MSQENKTAALSFIIVIIALLAAITNKDFFDRISLEEINGKEKAYPRQKKLPNPEFQKKIRIDNLKKEDKKKTEFFFKKKEYDMEKVKEHAGSDLLNETKKIYEMKQSVLKIWRIKQKNEAMRFSVAEMYNEGKELEKNRNHLRPYIYQNGIPERRLSQEEEFLKMESLQDLSDQKKYAFNQEIQQDEDTLVIHLILKKETDLQKNLWKYGVIFSQKIPEGYQFMKNENDSGWSSVKNGTLKFLALPSQNPNEIDVGLVFAQNKLIPATTVIQPASCCFQNDSGQKVLCTSL